MFNTPIHSYTTPIQVAIILLFLIALAISLVLKPEPSVAQGPQINLSEYQLVSKNLNITGVSQNASGLSYNPDSNTLFMVVNGPEQIIELDRQGKTLRRIKLHNFHDTEAIMYLGNNSYAITEERKGNIVLIKIDDSTTEISLSQAQVFNIAKPEEKNKGLEGLSYDFRYKQFYAVQEKSPKQLLAIPDPQLSPIRLKHRQLWNMENNKMKLDDLAGVHHDQITGNLLILSEESKKVIETSLNGELLSSMSLSQNNHGLTADIVQPEGITMDQYGRLYICSEPNHLFIFDKKDKIAKNVIEKRKAEQGRTFELSMN